MRIAAGREARKRLVTPCKCSTVKGRQPHRMEEPARAWERCSQEGGRNLHGLRREEHRLVPRRHRELVLLVIGGDEVVEAKFHHRHVQQVGGAHRLGQPMFAGENCDGIEDFVKYALKTGLPCPGPAIPSL